MATIWLSICDAGPDTTWPFIVTVRISSVISGVGVGVGAGVRVGSVTCEDDCTCDDCCEDTADDGADDTDDDAADETGRDEACELAGIDEDAAQLICELVFELDFAPEEEVTFEDDEPFSIQSGTDTAEIDDVASISSSERLCQLSRSKTSCA